MLHKFHILPSQFVNLPLEERAFIIASIDLKIKHDEEEAKKIKEQTRKK